MHIKPAVRHQGGHVIGNSVDEPDKPATTVLAIMVAPFMVFVVRLIPIYSLKADFLFEQVKSKIEVIHQNSGYVYLVMGNNL